tara:strand:- start:395 stop:688 length:294 start_codon:yes stop_codon:yes gene_type:complete
MSKSNVIHLKHRKKDMKTLSFAFLSVFLLSGCTTFSTAIDAGKKVGGALVDDTISVAQTAISLPVKAVGTVIDKIEEETEGPTVVTPEKGPSPKDKK